MWRGAAAMLTPARPGHALRAQRGLRGLERGAGFLHAAHGCAVTEIYMYCISFSMLHTCLEEELISG